MFYTCPRCKKDDLLATELRWNGIYIRCCNECARTDSRAYRASARGKIATRRVNVKQKFGITLEAVEQKIITQHNGCAICKKEFNEDRKSVIDHNHSTNEVRDILCYSCNSALGLVNEDEDIIWNLLEYIKKWNSKKEIAS